MVFEILALAGIVNILTRSYLLQTVRETLPWAHLRYAANCPQCTGVWVGAIYYLIAVCPYNSPKMLVEICMWAGMVSLVSSAITAALDYLSFAKSLLISRIPLLETEENTNISTTETDKS